MQSDSEFGSSVVDRHCCAFPTCLGDRALLVSSPGSLPFALAEKNSKAVDDGAHSRNFPSVSFLQPPLPSSVWYLEPLRVSRFLRAVGDPTSKFTTSSIVAAAEAAAAEACVKVSKGVGEASCPTDMPAAIEVTNRGILGRSIAASGIEDDADFSRSDSRGGDGGSENYQGVDQEEAAERNAIADIFRRVDLDASGQISQQELLEAVSNRALFISAMSRVGC